MAGPSNVPGGNRLAHSPGETRRGTAYQNRQGGSRQNLNEAQLRPQQQVPQAPALQPPAPRQQVPQAPALEQPAREQPVLQAPALEQQVPPPAVALLQQNLQPAVPAFVTVQSFQNFELQLAQRFQALTNLLQNLSTQINVNNQQLHNNNNNNLQQPINNNQQHQVLVDIEPIPAPIQPAPLVAQYPNQHLLGNPLLQRDNADIKFHPFMRQNPREWFEMLEQRFAARNLMADHDRYYNVIKNLPPEILVKVEYLLKSLPPQNKYETLKRALIEKFSEKEDTRINNFLNNTSMGALTPSEFLEFLTASGNVFFPRNSILKVWLERLPNSVSLLLDTEITEENEHLMVRKADKIFEKLNKDELTSINSISVEENISNK